MDDSSARFVLSFSVYSPSSDSTLESIEYMLRDHAYGMLYKQRKIVNLLKATGVRFSSSFCSAACQLLSCTCLKFHLQVRECGSFVDELFDKLALFVEMQKEAQTQREAQRNRATKQVRKNVFPLSPPHSPHLFPAFAFCLLCMPDCFSQILADSAVPPSPRMNKSPLRARSKTFYG